MNDSVKVRPATLLQSADGYVYQTHIDEPEDKSTRKPSYVKMLDILKANGRVLDSEPTTDNDFDMKI